MWKAYDVQSCFRETAGLRGVAPSIRFFEQASSFGEVEVMHVPSNEDVYIWGVEMFSSGYDCLKITYSPDSGSPFLIKDGGRVISDFNNKTEMIYVKNGIEIAEKYPFDDFWKEPYLVNNNEDVIVKSNFFRCFNFKNDGFYKIEVLETFNPKYRVESFSPVDFSAHSEYDNYSHRVTKSRLSQFESYYRQTAKLKKVIYIKAINRSQKDLVSGLSITRNVLNLPSGLIPYRNVGNTGNNSNVNPQVRITKVGPWHIKGNNSHFRLDTYYSPSYDPNSGWWGRSAFIAPEFLLNDFWDNYLEDSFRPYTTRFTQNMRSINMRNGILEDVHFYGSEFYGAGMLVVGPDSYWNNYATIPASERSAKGIPTSDDYQYPYQIVSNWLGNEVALDLRGMTIRNCVFDKYVLNLDHPSVMLDGTTFENCHFIGCGIGYMKSGGILFKNCTFEDISTNTRDVLTWHAGGSCCIMGCSQRLTERGTLISMKNGGFDDSIWIRHTLYGINRFQNADEHWTAEAIYGGGQIDTFHNNMWIMGRSAMGPGNFGTYSGNSKFNIVAFNSIDATTGGGEMFIYNDQSYHEVAYNCFLYNDTIGTRPNFNKRSKHTRMIKNIFRQTQNFHNPRGGFNWVAQDERPGIELYAASGWLAMSGYKNQNNVALSSLISDCTLVDYRDKESYFFGASYNSDNLFYISEVDPKVDDSAIQRGDNVIFNLRKIVENSSNGSYPTWQWS